MCDVGVQVALEMKEADVQTNVEFKDAEAQCWNTSAPAFLPPTPVCQAVLESDDLYAQMLAASDDYDFDSSDEVEGKGEGKEYPEGVHGFLKGLKKEKEFVKAEEADESEDASAQHRAALVDHVLFLRVTAFTFYDNLLEIANPDPDLVVNVKAAIQNITEHTDKVTARSHGEESLQNPIQIEELGYTIQVLQAKVEAVADVLNAMKNGLQEDENDDDEGVEEARVCTDMGPTTLISS